MPEPFAKSFQVGWRDLDSNGHMKNTAYLEMAVDVRMVYFQEHGFTMREFEQLRLGPVMSHDELEYYRELRLLDRIRVNFILAGSSDDGSRFRVRNEFFREDGKRVARVTSIGGWLDLSARKLIVPPEKLMEAVRGLARSEDFEPLKNKGSVSG